MVPIGTTPGGAQAEETERRRFCNLKTFGEAFDLKGQIWIQAKTVQKHSNRYDKAYIALCLRSSSAISSMSPTIPYFAIPNMDASGSLFTATIVSTCFIPH